jgi:hypothetical protein
MLCLGMLPLNRGGRSLLPRPRRQRPPAQRGRSAAKWSVGDLHVDAALGRPVGGWSMAVAEAWSTGRVAPMIDTAAVPSRSPVSNLQTKKFTHEDTGGYLKAEMLAKRDDLHMGLQHEELRLLHPPLTGPIVCRRGHLPPKSPARRGAIGCDIV